ncbi:polymorphic toxin-type HINT domain-containing protein [Paenibacillus aurantius]|uniref:Polymorphic toxin-type HINT domain-containing protein n=1 Tax=Paenibacillus aurantius TaxID=2918900 RepID=A0AA96RII1_9BACL|nr:polymorphic toxin-type HINT domain-containing protein [Paenibacillus aurantius]WNQ12224.1 polymorphic toxin-type HINT domain-containing protein [Paenibacillus aurantius]
MSGITGLGQSVLEAAGLDSVDSLVYGDKTVENAVYQTLPDEEEEPSGLPELLEQYTWNGANRLVQQVNDQGDSSRYAYDGDGNRVSMMLDLANGPKKRGNGKGNGNAGSGNPNQGGGKCHTVPPDFVPPGLAKKCGQVEEPYPDMHPGGPREGWEPQYKKKHWEFRYTNDVSLALPEPLMATEADETKWKETYTYGAGGERLSMTYLPAYDANNGWEPSPGAGGAEPGVAPRTLFYLTDALGSTLGLIEKDGRVSSRYHYDEFGTPLDAKKFDMNWPGPDNPFGYTGLGYDYNSGLTYARARYYKPEIGRFISEDTYKGNVVEPQSQNLYGYVQNNPLKYIDPSGHKIMEDSGGGGGTSVLSQYTISWGTAANVTFGAGSYLWNYAIDAATQFAKKETYTGMWEFTKAVVNGDISVVDIIEGMGEDFARPFQYLYQNFDRIWSNQGTYQEDYEYGAYFGEAIANIASLAVSFTGAGTTAFVAKIVEKAPVLAKVMKLERVASCNCFTAGTKVLTDEGEKNIEDVEVGDKVLAKDENNPEGELAYKEVTALYRNQRDDIIKLHVGEQVIETTDNHPFWVEGKGWVFADELQVGDKLQKADGSNLTIEKVEFVKLDEPVTVYNFTVADFHTYYVTDLGIWVHNTNCPDFSSLRSKGDPYQNHKVVTGRTLDPKGEPNTSVDLYNKDGVLTQRRYYGPDGKAQLDIDYDHSNADGTHTFPHRHEWDWTQKNPRQ